jgi:hypothetical protein
MNLDNIIDLIERIKSYWDKKIGILLLLILFIYIYYQYIFQILNSVCIGYEWLTKFVIPLIIIIILLLIWLLSTNRLYIKLNTKLL